MKQLVRATFLMEQQLGHRTYYQNLRRSIESAPLIFPLWIEVTYEQPSRFNLGLRLPLRIKHLIGTMIGRKQVLRGLASKPYDVAFFNTQAPAALALKMVKQKPYVISTDITPKQYDAFALEYNHYVDRLELIKQYKHHTNTILYQSAAYVLPWSNWVRSSLISDYGVNPDKVIVVHPGIDVNIWKPLRNKEKSRFRILFVGGDFYRKGGALLLEAYNKLDRNSSELVIVTKSSIPPQDGITVHQNMSPNSPELIALYQSCDAFVFPTQAEAFGIAAIEAAAVGLPVIATNVGGLSDIVLHEKTGFLVQKNNVDDLVNSIQLLIEQEDLRNQMGTAAREHVETSFNASKNAEQIQNLLIYTGQR